MYTVQDTGKMRVNAMPCRFSTVVFDPQSAVQGLHCIVYRARLLMFWIEFYWCKNLTYPYDPCSCYTYINLCNKYMYLPIYVWGNPCEPCATYMTCETCDACETCANACETCAKTCETCANECETCANVFNYFEVNLIDFISHRSNQACKLVVLVESI